MSESLPDRTSEASNIAYLKKYIGRDEPPQGIVTEGQFSNGGADAGGSPQNRSGSSKDA